MNQEEYDAIFCQTENDCKCLNCGHEYPYPGHIAGHDTDSFCTPSCERKWEERCEEELLTPPEDGDK